MTKRAAIYARYSTDLQTDKSIEDQWSLCESFAALQGYTVVKRYADRAMTGSSIIGRSSLMDLMEDGKARTFDVVVVEALDRLSRNRTDLSALYDQLDFLGIGIDRVHGGIVDELHIGIDGLISPAFLKGLKEKVRRGMAGVVRSGRSAGGRLYGYRPKEGAPGELVIEEAEAMIVRRIFAEYASGMSPRAIAHGLNRDKIPAPRGALWMPSTITGNQKRACGILRSELFIGKRIWNRGHMARDPATGRRVWRANPPCEWHEVAAKALAIVSAEDFELAQGRLAETSKRHANGQRLPRKPHLLSGLVFCGQCDGGMSLQGTMAGRSRVRCSRAKLTGTCSNIRPYYLDEIVAAVVTNLRDWLTDTESVEAFVAEYTAEMKRINAKALRERHGVARRIAVLEREMNRLLDALSDGSMPFDLAKAKIAPKEIDRQRLREELERADNAVPRVVVLPQALRAYRHVMETLAVSLDGLREAGPEARAAMQTLIGRVNVRPGDPATVELVGRIMALTAHPDKLLKVVAEEETKSALYVTDITRISIIELALYPQIYPQFRRVSSVLKLHFLGCVVS